MIAGGKEFQVAGAAQLKDRFPILVRLNGTSRNGIADDRSDRVLLWCADWDTTVLPYGVSWTSTRPACKRCAVQPATNAVLSATICHLTHLFLQLSAEVLAGTPPTVDWVCLPQRTELQQIEQHTGYTLEQLSSGALTSMLQPSASRLDWIVQCFTSPPTQYRL